MRIVFSGSVVGAWRKKPVDNQNVYIIIFKRSLRLFLWSHVILDRSLNSSLGIE